MLIEHIKSTLTQFIDDQIPQNPIFALRHAYCGAKFDLDTLEELKWIKACAEEEVIWLEKPITDFETQWVVQLCFSIPGYLRDIVIFKFSPDAEIDEIQQRDDHKFPHKAALESDFAEAMIDPVPDTDELEFYMLTDGWKIKKFEDYSTKRRTAYTFMAILEEYADKESDIAKRFLVGASRWPNYLPRGDMLSTSAYYAFELGLKIESAILLRVAFDSFDPDRVLVEAGCVLDRLGFKQEACDCFSKAAELGSKNDLARENLWIAGVSLATQFIQNGKYRPALEVLEQILTHSELAKESEISKTWSASALCCEGLALLDEAKDRYITATNLYSKNNVALLGLNRLMETDKKRRSEGFKQQLQAFPATPHEKGMGDMLPIKFIEGLSHGNHWECLLPDPKYFFENSLRSFLSNDNIDDGIRIHPSERVRGDMEAVYSDSFPESTSPFCISLYSTNSSNEALRLESLVPSSFVGKEVSLKVHSLQEWGNGVEGSVCASTDGGSLTLFDPRYYRNKSIYKKHHEYSFILTGFVFNIWEAEEREFTIAPGPAALLKNNKGEKGSQTFVMGKEMTLLKEIEEYPSEYGFWLPVLDVSWAYFLENKICCIHTHCHFSEESIPITLYVGEHLLTRYVPKKGDAVGGSLWLQGHLISDVGRPIEVETNEDWIYGGALEYSKIDEEKGVHYWATRSSFNNCKGIHQYSVLPIYFGNQPQFVAEGGACKRAYVYVHEFFSGGGKWATERQAIEEKLNSTISLNDLPVFIVGVEAQKAGEGYLFDYHDWDILGDWFSKKSE